MEDIDFDCSSYLFRQIRPDKFDPAFKEDLSKAIAFEAFLPSKKDEYRLSVDSSELIDGNEIEEKASNSFTLFIKHNGSKSSIGVLTAGCPELILKIEQDMRQRFRLLATPKNEPGKENPAHHDIDFSGLTEKMKISSKQYLNPKKVAAKKLHRFAAKNGWLYRNNV